MDRRAFLRSVIVGTLTAPFVTRQAETSVRLYDPQVAAWIKFHLRDPRVIARLQRESKFGQIAAS